MAAVHLWLFIFSRVPDVFLFLAHIFAVWKFKRKTKQRRQEKKQQKYTAPNGPKLLNLQTHSWKIKTENNSGREEEEKGKITGPKVLQNKRRVWK